MRTHHRLALAAVLFSLAGLAQAQPSAHYVPGVEGLDGATLPPPGLWVRDYNVAYTSSSLNDRSGNKIDAANLSTFTYANIPRVLWITDTKFLEGNVGVDALLPLVYNSTRANTPGGPFNDATFGIGDFFLEGTLSWHPKQFDFAFGFGLWMPTGDYNPSNPTRAGLGCWTPMFTAGATWHIDEARTWSVSALNRYEISTEQSGTDITPGQAYTLEWGIGKTIEKVWGLGVAGYYQQQATSTSGTLVSSPLNRVAAVGPEVTWACPKHMLFLSLRYNYEFMAESRAQGQTFCLTLTKKI